MQKATFMYVMPTEAQTAAIAHMRDLFTAMAQEIEKAVPPGPDQTFIIRRLRTTAMWVNVAITREPDGAPRG